MYQESNDTIFKTKSLLKQALFKMELDGYYADTAIKQYEQQKKPQFRHEQDGKTLINYNLEEIIEIIMQLRALHSPNNMPQDSSLPVMRSPEMRSKKIIVPTISTAGGIYTAGGMEQESSESNLNGFILNKIDRNSSDSKNSGFSSSFSDHRYIPDHPETENENNGYESSIIADGDIETIQIMTPEGKENHYNYVPKQRAKMKKIKKKKNKKRNIQKKRRIKIKPLPPKPQERRHGHGHEKSEVMDNIIASMIAAEQFQNGESEVDDDNDDNNNNNNVLSLLSEIKSNEYPNIKRIEQEIVSTEREYYEGLNILYNEWILPIFDNKYLDKNKYFSKIISSIPSMISFHGEFLTKLNTVFNSKYKSLLTVFNKFILQKEHEFVQIYVKFIADYNEILNLFGNTFHGNKLLNQFLKKQKKENNKNLSFLDYLILPIKRIPCYIKLLKKLKKYINNNGDNDEEIDKSLVMMQEITELINSQQQDIKNIAQCLEIQQSLYGLKYPIIDTEHNNRKFEGKYYFIEKDTHHQRIFYIFNDIVIITNIKEKVKYILDVRTMDIKINDNDNLEFTLITGISKPMIFLSMTSSDISTIEKLIEVNRYDIWAQDIMDNDNGNKSLSGSLRNQLAHQLAIVL